MMKRTIPRRTWLLAIVAALLIIASVAGTIFMALSEPLPVHAGAFVRDSGR